MATSPTPSAEFRRHCEANGYARAVCNRGFPYLLELWAATVASVEAGYDALFDEYLNDVDSRQLIDELATYATDEEWAAVDVMLPDLDERFRAATRPVLSCVWGEHNAEKHGYSPIQNWWYYRLPFNVGLVAGRERWP